MDLMGHKGRILYVLWQNDNLPIIELSRKTGLAKTTLTSMLDRLELNGHVCRNYVKSDRRKVKITLTEKAKSMSNDYNRVSDKMSEIFYKGFSDDEINSFEEYLKQILKNLTESEKSV